MLLFLFEFLFWLASWVLVFLYFYNYIKKMKKHAFKEAKEQFMAELREAELNK